MKAVLRSDLYFIRSFAKVWLAVIVFMMVYGKAQDNATFMGFYPTFFAVMLPYTLGSLDESTQWRSHLLSLPVTRRQLVAGRYLTVAGFVVCMSLISLAGMLVLTSDSAYDCVCAVTVCAACGFALSAFILPLVYRMGALKARYVMLPVFMIPFLIAVLIPDGTFAGPPPAFLEAAWFPAAALGAAVILYAVSALVSAALIGKRDL